MSNWLATTVQSIVIAGVPSLTGSFIYLARHLIKLHVTVARHGDKIDMMLTAQAGITKDMAAVKSELDRIGSR